MATQFTKQQILDIVNHQLLFWIKEDEAVKEAVFELVHSKYSTKKETDDKFEKMLKELANDRKSQEKKWEEWNKKYEINRANEEKRWEAQEKKWEAQEKKWEENRKITDSLLAEVKIRGLKLDQTIGAVGARWGLHSEAAFRNALTGILSSMNPGYDIINYQEFDEEGIVFDKPDQVEIDIIVKDGVIYIIEMKSSVSKADIAIFLRKVKFYEKRHKQKVFQQIVISPMINEAVRKYAIECGLTLYGYADEVIF